MVSLVPGMVWFIHNGGDFDCIRVSLPLQVYHRPMQGSRISPDRSADRHTLALALAQVRTRTLAMIEAWQRSLSGLQVPQTPTLNPPLWEWGHVAWFQEWWTVRHPQPRLGTRGHPDGRHGPSILPHADGLYNSSTVAHERRWTLPLPDLHGTRDYMAHVLALSLARLADIGDDHDDALYFWRLALFHEAMHHEAWVIMAQTLGVEMPDHVAGRPVAPPPDSINPALQIEVPRGPVRLGCEGPGFAFDNEQVACSVELSAFEIDARPISWRRYLDFIHQTGYRAPAHLRTNGTQWWMRRFSQWLPLPLDAPATHLSALDAEAWCAWAGRQLPSEAQWCAAVAMPDFEWGQVWEWTRTPFEPFAGFETHPYEDYSVPWWGTHRVLKGASWATPDCMVDHRFRNFYLPRRHDLLAGFRSVNLG